VFADDEARPTSSGSVTTEDEKTSPEFSQRNAWDDIPEIERYIGQLQKNRKGNIQVLQGYGSELERPSLPVTPAPIRRPSFWGEERDDSGELPPAEGVPAQADWDPAAQLEMLARRQSDVLANKLGNPESLKQLPTRPLPYGSEGIKSPTFTTQRPLSGGASPHGIIEATSSSSNTTGTTTIEDPSFKGPGAQWEKDEGFPMEETPLGPSEEEKDVLDN